MLKGDLTSTPLAPLLLELAEDSATGCLVITDSAEDEALVYFKNGLVYSVAVPGSRPQLGAKLVSSGALAPEALSEALEAQRTELQGWRLGELLVHLGYVDQPVVEAFVAEQVSEALWDLLRWYDGRWRFRKNVKAREDVGPPMAIVDLLETLRERGYVWETISAVVHGPGAIPRLSTRGDTSNETTLDNDAWSMLCKIDGERSVAELAADCGYTLFEAGHVIVSLVQAGLVDIDEEIDIEGSALYGATTLSSALAGELDDAPFTPAEPDDEDALSKLARLVTEVAGTGEATAEGSPAAAEAAPVAPAQRRENETPMTVSLNRSGESFAASIARVSGALSEVLGELPPPDIDTEELAARRRRAAPSTDDPEWQRRKRLRSAAAAELASAQALIETLRPDRDDPVADPTPEYAGDVPKVVSRAAERERAAARKAEDTARHDEEAARHAADAAARESAEQFARAAAEEADRVAAEQEAARVAAEQAAAEAAERLEAEAAAATAAEAERQAAEQAAAEQAAEDAAEAAAVAEAAERVEAERAAAEEAAWAEYWHREEAERAAAEAAARVAAEQEAERIAADQAEQAATAEAERIAAEEAARQAEAAAAAQAEAQAAADRIAAEAAARQAEADAAARAEYERIAAEQAARQAEADRVAAEAAEAQAKADAETAAAEAKAAAAAQRKADKAAAAEAAKREDEAAAAAALLAEFAASAAPEEPEAKEPAYEPAPEEHAAAEVREPVAVGGGYSDADTTDTAALLRELSSLGGDDDRDAQSGPPVPPRPRPNAAPDKKVKKKIGLFGL